MKVLYVLTAKGKKVVESSDAKSLLEQIKVGLSYAHIEILKKLNQSRAPTFYSVGKKRKGRERIDFLLEKQYISKMVKEKYGRLEPYETTNVNQI